MTEVSIDYSLTEEQELLRQSLREFFERECPRTLVREIEDQERDYSPELYRKLAATGFLGLPFPEAYGGGGGSFADLALFYEEAGRVLLPGPHFSTLVLGGLPVLHLGTEAQKQEVLPRIARGECIIAFALTEAEDQPAARTIATTALPSNDHLVLEGRKLFVSFAHVAQYLLVVARTDPSAPPERGLSLLLVEASTPGIAARPLKTVAGERYAEVTFSGVRVPRSSLLGELNRGHQDLPQILDPAKVVLSAWMVGGAQAALDMAVAYVKDRVQFEQPIGRFQAVQHKLANVAMAVDGARLLVYKSAWMVGQGLPVMRQAAQCKAYANEAFRLATSEGIQVHGGYGFMREFDMQLYFRRMKAAELTLGSTLFQKDLIADSLDL